MAKGKHAAALFEVIQRDKRFERKNGITGVPRNTDPASLSTPKWWFKRRPGADPAPLPVPPAPAPLATPPPVERRPAPAVVAPPPVRETRSMDLDAPPRRQHVSLRLTYSGVAVGAFALMVAVGLAYVIGRHMSRGPSPVLAEIPTEELRRRPAQPSVMDVHAASPNIVQNTQARVIPAPPGNAAVTSKTTGGTRGAAPAPPKFNDARPPATLVVDDQTRQYGLNYVIVQSYPDKKSAEDVRDLLVKNGVFCSVEQLKHFAAPKWYSVVGIKGFDKIHNSPEFDGYVAEIMRIGDRSGLKGFKRFEPTAYKWR
jgi:hypothetical protein